MNLMRPALAGVAIFLLAATGWDAAAVWPWTGTAAAAQGPAKAGPRLSSPDAVAAAGRVLPVKGLRVQGVTLIAQWEGLPDPVYNILWSQTTGGVQAPCAVAAVSARTGQVLQYVSFAVPQGHIAGASRSRLGIAKDWAGKLAGARFAQFSHTPTVSPPVQGLETFTFFRMVHGIPVSFDSIQVSIDATGQMTDYQFFWRPDAIPGHGPVVSRSIAERNWIRAVGLHLAYVAAQSGKGGALLAYIPRVSPFFSRGPWASSAYGAPWILAATGGVLNPAGQAPAPALPAADPAQSHAGSGPRSETRLGVAHRSGAPGTEPLEAGKGETVGTTASGEPKFPPRRRVLLTAGQCATLARRALGLPPSAAASDAQRSLWGPDAFGNVETVWTLSFSGARGLTHVAVDARTGLILYVGRAGVSDAAPSGGPASSSAPHPAVRSSRAQAPLSESKSIDLASDFVERVLPGLSGSFVPSGVRLSPGGAGGPGLTVDYTLFVRRIPAEFDRVSVTVNRQTGDVTYYFASLASPGGFPSASATVSPHAAAAVYIRNFPLALAYVLPSEGAPGGPDAKAGNPQAVLAYVPVPRTGGYELDAKTGTWIAASNLAGQ